MTQELYLKPSLKLQMKKKKNLIKGENRAMDLSPFKFDIDELINEFVERKFTTLADMKQIWLSRKFSCIFEASPSSKHGLFMQSLYAHSIGYITSDDSLSRRLGGLYCLYCLYETQPFKPPFKIYISLGELKRLQSLVVNAKEQKVQVVPALVKRMLEKNMFLFGFVDLNDGSEILNQFTELQNARVKLAYEKLFGDTKIEQFLHMDMGKDFDLNMLKKMSADYARLKKEAIKAASEVVDVQSIQHISNDGQLIGDVVEKITEDWNAQKEVFYEGAGLIQYPTLEEQHNQIQERRVEDDEFYRELELELCEEACLQQKEENEDFSHESGLQHFRQQEHIDQDVK